MLAYVNGQFIAADRPVLPVNDRSFLYGDGLFETIRITNGQPFLWNEHLERLQRGAAFLKIPFSISPKEIEQAARHLLSQNDMPEGMLRIHLSRGPGERGYGIKSANTPTLVITTHQSLHSKHPGLKLITSTIRVAANDPLTQHKTANRLANILARNEADDAGADEAIILNNEGHVAECSAANIFCVRGHKLLTPPLSSGALAGTTRQFVLNKCFLHDLYSEEVPLTVDDLRNSDAVFVTSAHWLVTPVSALDGAPICALCASDKTPPHPVVAALRRDCEHACLNP